RALDRLPLRADHGALDGLARPQHRVDLVRPVAGLDLVGDDLMGVVALPAGSTVEEHLVADDLENIVGGRAEDEQMPLAGGDDDLKRAVYLARHRRVPFSVDPSGTVDRGVLDAGLRDCSTGPLLGHLAADRDAAGYLDVDLLLDRALGPRESNG